MLPLENGPGLGQLEAYLAIIALACLGHEAVFLQLSMMFRNPVPAAMLMPGWEAINPLPPSVPQKISVASHLHHRVPITSPGPGIFALLTVQTGPVAGRVAAIGLVILIIIALAYSCVRIRRNEIRYTADRPGIRCASAEKRLPPDSSSRRE